MEVATMEDKEGGAADEDLDLEDFDPASSGCELTGSKCRRL